MKYRIVKRPEGCIIQARILFWWADWIEYELTEDECYDLIKKWRARKNQTVVWSE